LYCEEKLSTSATHWVSGGGVVEVVVEVVVVVGAVTVNTK